MFNNYAEIDTPKTSETWNKLDDQARLDLVISATNQNPIFQLISPTRTTKSGQVLITLTENIPASKRGMLILDYEEFLKNKIDQGINVWCESLGDKNSLRNLRGIQIKS
ncbi:MAG: hypothetical protein L6Q54_12645 [Leptospiraceae bacterium]|nr:hypothetical protein [Leptospiraceae bacterium]MCK6382082.1 hypothetical protein [Leptospiraceae bacterium]